MKATLKLRKAASTIWKTAICSTLENTWNVESAILGAPNNTKFIALAKFR
jgi:hypothetical protein